MGKRKHEEIKRTLKDPCVRLERDPKLESLIAKDMEKDKGVEVEVRSVDVEVAELNTQVGVDQVQGKCFVCGSFELASGGQARRRYQQQTALFKDSLMNIQVRRNISPVVYNHFTNNVGSCSICLGMIKGVWDLQQQLLSIRQELDEVVAKGRKALVARCNGSEETDRLTVVKVTGSNKTAKPRPSATLSVEPELHVVELDGIKVEDKLSKSKPEDDEFSDYNQNPDDEGDDDEFSDYDLNREDEEDDDVDSEAQSELHKRKSTKAKSKSKIKRNKPVDIGGRKLECSKCGKKFSKAIRLISHEVKVCKIQYDEEEIKRMNIKFYQCDQCDLKFFEMRAKERHIRTHTKEKPFICQKCGKSYTQISTLKLHNKTYCRAGGIDPEFRKKHLEKQRLKKNKGPLKCPKCSRRFITSDKLAAHVKTHETSPDNTGIICEFCGKRISSSYGVLQKHIRRVHSMERNVFCTYCGKGYFENNDLLQHVKNHHEKDKNVEQQQLPQQKFKCDQCDKYFNTKTALYHHRHRRHIGTKHLECDVCHIKIYSKCKLLKHQKTHNTEIHKCLKCGLRFAWLLRLQRHQKTKPNCDQMKCRQYTKKKEQFTCPHCQEVFPGRFRFKLHMKHVHPNHFIDEGNDKDDYQGEEDECILPEMEVDVSTSEAGNILECEVVSDAF